MLNVAVVLRPLRIHILLEFPSKYALVDSEDDGAVSVVPLGSIVDPDKVVIGTSCSVQWKKVAYKATVLDIGMLCC